MKQSSKAGSKWVPLPACMISSVRSSGSRAPVGAVAGQRVEDVDYRDDATGQQDLLAGQTGRIAISVEVLMVGDGDLRGEVE